MSDLVGTKAQVAEALETTETTVTWLKQHRGLPYVYINRKEWRVPWASLVEWLATEVARNALQDSTPTDDQACPRLSP